MKNTYKMIVAEQNARIILGLILLMEKEAGKKRKRDLKEWLKNQPTTIHGNLRLS